MKMAYVDELKALTVRIGGKDGGSGVLVKPLDNRVLYILTAWHCIKDIENDNYDITFADGQYQNIKIETGEVYHDENTDAAIIMVNRFADVRYVGFASKPEKPQVTCYHTGFPHCRADYNSEREYATRNIDSILHDSGGLVEYTYAKIPAKHELTGMSGGGIFDNEYHLLGIHKQSVEKDEKELLGSALYIPCSHYLDLIVKKELSPICQFDISSFKSFQDCIFNFDNNQGAKRDLQDLLGEMSAMQVRLMKKSPGELFEGFQNLRKCSKKVKANVLNKEDWARFGEFLLAAKILKPDKVTDYEAEQIGSFFQYVYSERDFDIVEVRDGLDINKMGRYMGKECIYVVGGIRSGTVTYDRLEGKKVPDLSVAYGSEEFDIADGGKGFMNNLTFINCHIFRDVMEFYGPNLKAPDSMVKYKDLLKKYIYG